MGALAEQQQRLSRDQYAKAVGLQRKGATLTEIARVIDADRSAVVECLYDAVVKRRRPHLMEFGLQKVPYAGSNKKSRSRVRLKGHDGRWLHMSGEGLTLVRADSWVGTPEQLFMLRKLHPNLNSMTVCEA